MPNTYTKIASVTVQSGGASSIDFTSIPSTYTDLCVKVSTRLGTGNFPNVRVQFNGNTSNYSHRILFGSGTSAGSYSGTNDGIDYISDDAASQTSNTFSNSEIYIPNYAGSSNKSISVDAVSENNAADAYSLLTAGLWSNTSAITSLKIYSGGGQSFVQYSTATLYGVTSSAVGAKATGGIISTDGAYFYHTFTASGTFTPTQSLTCDYAIVAGGGGGGNILSGSGGAGGGGAGGFRTFTGQSFSATGYTVTVGAGGPANTNGNTTTFNSTSASGGGRGGSETNGNAGGSGGGAGRLSTSTTGGAGNSGSYTPVEGYKGGDATASANSLGAGGGGSGGAGVNATVNGVGSAGGAGTVAIDSKAYAGGGGGGSYIGNQGASGQAGGGSGGGGSNGNPANANSGSGGGGGGSDNLGNTFVGGAGGSGVVIVRYAV